VRPRSCVSLETVPASVGAVLRRADKHFHEVIVQGVEELALKAPFELWMVEVARMEIKIIGMHRNGGVFELNDNFHTLAFGARGEVQ